MKCAACNGTLTESEQKINEWGFLEIMCKFCMEVGRSATYDSEVYELQVLQHEDLDFDERIPGWAITTKIVGDYLIAFEQEPLWDEEEEVWVVREGKAQPIGYLGEDEDGN